MSRPVSTSSGVDEPFDNYVDCSDRYDYPHFVDEPDNPLMESSLHIRWVTRLVDVVSQTIFDKGIEALVVGNTPFLPPDGGAQTAPDLMVVPGRFDHNVTRYVIGVDGPAPSVCIEVTSRSNTRAQLERRCGRWLRSGVAEVYVIDPERETVLRWELDDTGGIVESDARGTYSPALNLTFAAIDGHLALCCVAGRAVRLWDRPYEWLSDEQRRADDATARADDVAARLAELERRLRNAGIDPDQLE